jgi:hypothetical protein
MRLFHSLRARMNAPMNLPFSSAPPRGFGVFLDDRSFDIQCPGFT